MFDLLQYQVASQSGAAKASHIKNSLTNPALYGYSPKAVQKE